MPYLLNALYIVALCLGLPWLVYQAVFRGKYREGWGQKLLGLVPRCTSPAPCVWFHAVSVGEVNLLPGLLEALAAHRPEWQCVVSTTTATGMAVARRKFPNRTVFYCPADFSWAVREAMRRVRPEMLVLCELELWPNLVWAARRHGAKIAVINGRLGVRSFRGYQRVRPLIARVLAAVDLVAAQDREYAERFCALGARPETVHVTGSMKYDGAETDRRNPATERLRRLARIADDDVVFLAGSTQAPEEAMALRTFTELSPHWPRLRLVLVPRHPHRFGDVARLLEASGLPWQRRTAIGEGPSSAAPRILLVDTVGELGAWWGTATIAFVGGSLGRRGGQNMIEPAAYGAAVCFGPNTWNFRDVVATLLQRDAAQVVRNAQELTAFVRRCLEEPEFASGLGQRAQQLVAEQSGATARTLHLLEALLRR